MIRNKKPTREEDIFFGVVVLLIVFLWAIVMTQSFKIDNLQSENEMLKSQITNWTLYFRCRGLLTHYNCQNDNINSCIPTYPLMEQHFTSYEEYKSVLDKLNEDRNCEVLND